MRKCIVLVVLGFVSCYLVAFNFLDSDQVEARVTPPPPPPILVNLCISQQCKETIAAAGTKPEFTNNIECLGLNRICRNEAFVLRRVPGGDECSVFPNSSVGKPKSVLM